ncbi:FG-GAP-like repeat-containing protein [Paenarthrobacter sp. NPDC089714]|uniref:FG-GAP-like repeat-containing protein n=1 Tax=Paenarthrobacter sp. NPDC089714 TaxID=3364377 RepID=UPI0038299125
MTAVLIATTPTLTAHADTEVTTVRVGINPGDAAVNQVTNKIYVPNEDGTVTVIDGATNQAQTIRVGGWPGTVAVNSKTNKIYVGHQGGDVLSVIDGATNAVTSVAIGSSSWGVAVSETTNKILVPSDGAMNVIDGKTNAIKVIPHVIKGTGYRYKIVVNKVTNKAYFGGEGFFAEFDLLTNSVTPIERGIYIDDLALNTKTNKIYVAGQYIPSGSRTLVVDGATRAVHGIDTGRAPAVLGINEQTNTIFSLNPNTNSLILIDGLSESQRIFPVDDSARDIAVNAMTNKVYVSSPQGLSVLNVVTSTLGRVRTSSNVFHEITINEKTNRIYANDGYTTTVIDGTDVAPKFILGTPPNGRVGSSYAYGFSTSGSLTPAVRLKSGSIPPGLSLNGDYLSGIPTVPGTYSFSLAATNGIAPDAATPTITITIKPRDIRSDYNADGKTDILARDAGGLLWLYPGNGNGGWLPRLQVGQGWNVMREMAAPGDFTGDGFDDLLARDSTDTLWLYPGDGHSGWLPRRAVGWGWGAINTMFPVGDFDIDGNADIVGRRHDGSLILYRGNGGGGWSGQIELDKGYGTLNFLGGVGDINDDGNEDIIGRDGNGTLYNYASRGGRVTYSTAVGWGWNVMTAIATPGDFNGDGNVDLLARDAAGTLWLYPGNGKSGWLPRVQVGSGWNVMNAII